jgi:hypothetical protein
LGAQETQLKTGKENMLLPSPKKCKKEKMVGVVSANNRIERLNPGDGHKMRTQGAKISAQVSNEEMEAKWAKCPQCQHEGWMGTYCLPCKDQGMIQGPVNHSKDTSR